MGQEPNDKQSIRSEAIAVLLAAGAGIGIGWAIWLATDNHVLAIIMASPIAALTNSILRKVLK